ncbi:hypothetical protein P1X15_07280 [Runella sp. MFBS21]|uniref:hypothetical protein n=1 Tax=Runella sp. MFBS21 TaxID=3034018 RepID=UPI0023F62718|nr:hypothetical protein [Runella sp. MFBS21]MDF7817389.1 hypothetical protein [Runella sp. MFBS21]
MENNSHQIRLLTEGSIWRLTEGSIWLDDKKRTIVVFRIIWENAVNVKFFELLVIPEMKIYTKSAKLVENLLRMGVMQFCRNCERE